METMASSGLMAPIRQSPDSQRLLRMEQPLLVTLLAMISSVIWVKNLWVTLIICGMMFTD